MIIGHNMTAMARPTTFNETKCVEYVMTHPLFYGHASEASCLECSRNFKVRIRGLFRNT